MFNEIFFIDFNSFFRIFLSALLLYLTIIIFIRISGKRTSSKMNNFDWIIVVATGSLIASGIMTKDASILDVVLSIGLLLGFQYILTWSIIPSERIADLVKATPRLLVYPGCSVAQRACLYTRSAVSNTRTRRVHPRGNRSGCIRS